jgi:hypothetical protein
MTNMLDPKIVELAQGYLPIYFFDPLERLFPCATEEWLTHQAAERWDAITTHQRGTAVLAAQKAASAFAAADVLAGNDPPQGGPITLDGTPPNGIGQPFGVAPATQDLFIDCAGWDDTSTEVAPGESDYATGSIDYLDKLFRGLSHAMNGAIPADAPNPPPKFTVPRLTSPTVYVEVEWAGRYPRLDQQRAQKTGGTPDFPLQAGPPGAPGPATLTALDSYVVLTYYMFYAAMQPSPVAQSDPDTSRNREGQWEAISIFLKGRADTEHRDKDGRPDILGIGVSADLFTVPKFAVYSRGYGLGDDNTGPLAAEVRPWTDPLNRPAMSVTALNSHPFAYVSAGTHKNFYEIIATTTTGPTQPNPVLNTTGGAMMGAAGTAAGVCLGLAPPPLTPACIVCLIIAAVVFLIGFILWLLSLFMQTDPQTTEAPQSSAPGTDVARDGGPSAPPPGVTVSGPPGLPPTAQIPVNLRVVSRFKFDPIAPVTTYPLPAPGVVEMPSWWQYSGRWGVRIMNRVSGQWDSGTRRVDEFERSRGYWNTYQLVSFLGDPARATDGITA